MADPNWLGARLRELREQAGLTQQQVADAVGCTWEAVSRWERGTREPGWSQVLALAGALGVDCNAFAQEPAQPAAEKPKRGRPPKAASEGRAAAAPAQSQEAEQEKPAGMKGKRKGG
jgi:transcriptional regulator with XRE-family HTH domain